MSRLGWIDATGGVAGDMLLGALHDLGVLDDLPALAGSLPGLAAKVEVDEVRRGGQRAVAVTVTAPDQARERRLADLLALVAASGVEPVVADRAAAVFERLATAEAKVHGVAVGDVHFHEVGAVDALVDVLGACLGLHRLGADRITISEIGLGRGSARTRHGVVPVPGPAVLQLLSGTGLVAGAGAADFESATPTGVALVAEWAQSTEAMPTVTVDRIGVGAGGRDLPDRANVVRVVTGTAVDTRPAREDWVVVEANVDDLDPRLWPTALDALLAAGAVDAWLTPIVMKKGRPAHTIHALAEPGVQAAVGDALFAHTSTIGFRSHPVAKRAAGRELRSVEVLGRRVGVKVATRPQGGVVTATPEWEDVRAAAEALGLPVRRVLALAQAAASTLLD